MKQINVSFYIDEKGIAAEAGNENLAKTINNILSKLSNDRMYFEKWNFTETEKELPQEPQKVFCLCEEFEDSDAIRQFQILAVSTDHKKLRELMQAKIRQDEYGFIKEKGISENEEDHFSTEFDCGFVEYYIQEQQIRNREEMDRMLKPYKKASLDAQIEEAKQMKEKQHSVLQQEPGRNDKEQERE